MTFSIGANALNENGGTVGPINVTIPAGGVTAGSALVLCVEFENNAAPATISDAAGQSLANGRYRLCAQGTKTLAGTPTIHAAIYVVDNTKALAAASTINVTQTNSGLLCAYLVEVKTSVGIAVLEASNAAATGSASTADPTVTLTTVSANTMIVAWAFGDNNMGNTVGNVVNGSGTTALTTVSNIGLPTTFGDAVEVLGVSSPGSQAITIHADGTSQTTVIYAVAIGLLSSATLRTQARTPGFPPSAPLPGIAQLGKGLLVAPSLPPTGLISGESDASATATATLTGIGALVGTDGATAGQSGTLGVLAPSIYLLTQQRVPGFPLGAPIPGIAQLGTGILESFPSSALLGTLNAFAGQSATLTGAGALVGESDAVAGQTGTLTGVGALIGTSNAVATGTGTLGGLAALAGESDASATATATLTGTGALVGESDASANQTGTLTGTLSTIPVILSQRRAPGFPPRAPLPGVALLGVGLLIAAAPGALNGAVGAVATATATLTGAGALVGQSDAAADKSGTLTATGALSGSSSATATATGTLTGAGTLAGSDAAIAGQIGTLSSGLFAVLSTQVRVPGFPPNAPLPGIAQLGKGVLVASQPIPLGAIFGSSQAVGTATATLTGSGALVGSDPATGGQSGTLTGVGALVATLSATAGQTGTLIGIGGLVGTDGATATATGLLSAGLIGTLSAIAGEAGTLLGSGALVGPSTAIGSATGNLVNGNGQISGTLSASAGESATLTLAFTPRRPFGWWWKA